LVAKKGYEDLLAALALLPPGLEWRFVHIGGGALKNMLLSQAARLGLSRKIEWRGALTQPDVLAGYRQADLFVLASKLANDGDRDGLPNVLIEAQSQRLACVATDVSGIPELIEKGVTGLLVRPNDPVGLSRAISELIRDPARRAAMGVAGERRVNSNFAMKSGIDVLAMRFGLLVANQQAISLEDASQPLHDTNRAGGDAVLRGSGFPSRGVLVPQQLGK
jgi:glycosyltransferase involved in cell wall biosynthesis